MGKVVFGSFASAREREREREKERDEGKTELSQQHFVKERSPLVAMTSITKFVARYLGSISHVKVRDLPGHIHKDTLDLATRGGLVLRIGCSSTRRTTSTREASL